MKAFVLSATAATLIGFTANAQDEDEGNAQQAERPRWSESAGGESSLLTQLDAVIDSLRGPTANETRQVTMYVINASDTIDNSSSSGECRSMPAPGSRIRTQRCFYESEAERALNEYQFNEELRFARQEEARRQLEEANRALEAEARMRLSRPAGLPR